MTTTCVARACFARSTLAVLMAHAIAMASLAGLGACTSRQNGADSRLRALYTAEWKWREEQLADGEDSQRPVVEHLPRVDPASQRMRLRYWEDVRAKLDNIPRAELSSGEKVNYDIYRPQIEVLVANQRFREYEMPANSDTTFWTNLGYTARRPFRTLQDYRNWIKQLHDVPRYFQEQMDEMRAGLKRGFTPPRVTMEGRDASIIAVTDVTPEVSLHALGEAEVARLHGEMLAVMKETGFQGDFAAFLRFLRTDPRFYAKSADELLMHAAWIAKQFDGKASRFFGYLPRARFAIKPVPEDLAPFYTAGRGGPGVYLLNTYNLPARPLYNLTALTLHESAPGHAFQIPIAAEHTNQPAFRRRTYISAYGEGWALYCELLGVEMNMYDSPYDRFGMLGYQIWRAARLVVDTGIHSQGWSRERALDYLREYTALPQHEIETEVDRYIAWPGQALSYYLGERAIVQARDKARAALGPNFNIRAFHDAVLELGSVPLPLLSARIDRFIAEGGKGPYPDME